MEPTDLTTTAPTALVTGASRGIGAVTARALAARGYRVAVNYLSNRQAADGVVTEIETAGGQAFAAQGDVRDPEQAAELLHRAAEDGHLDLLVCNAAAAQFTPTPIQDLAWKDFHAKLTDEFAAVYTLTQLALGVMAEQGRGRIIYVSSATADGPSVPGMTAHGTAKAALNTFARFVAVEAAPLGINVNVVAPTYVRTEASAHIPAEVQQRIAQRIPLGRVAEAEDVAGAIAMLAGDEARFVAGVVLRVDGGRDASRM